MSNIIISYTYKGLNSATRNIVRKKLLGHTDTQKERTYVYKKAGLLDTIKHTKIQRGVLLTSKRNSNQILTLFTQFGVTYEIYNTTKMVEK